MSMDKAREAVIVYIKKQLVQVIKHAFDAGLSGVEWVNYVPSSSHDNLHQGIEKLASIQSEVDAIPLTEEYGDDLAWARSIADRYVKSGPSNAIAEAFKIFQAAQRKTEDFKGDFHDGLHKVMLGHFSEFFDMNEIRNIEVEILRAIFPAPDWQPLPAATKADGDTP